MEIEKIHIPTLLENLTEERSVFHSEADFQFALAWCLREMHPRLQIRLEYPLDLPGHKYCDIMLLQGGKFVMAIELKHRTRELEYENKGESFTLKNQSAQDLGRYGVLQDVERMECFLEGKPKAQASVIFVTNEYLYWKGSRNGTADEEFDIREEITVTGVKKWKGEPRDWKKGHINIRGTYKMEWQDYSEVNGRFGKFRYLYIPIQTPS